MLNSPLTMPLPFDYSQTFATGSTAEQLRRLGAIVVEHEPQVTAWLLCNPAIVDRLCVDSGLSRRGHVGAGVRQLVRLAKEKFASGT